MAPELDLFVYCSFVYLFVCLLFCLLISLFVLCQFRCFSSVMPVTLDHQVVLSHKIIEISLEAQAVQSLGTSWKQ